MGPRPALILALALALAALAAPRPAGAAAEVFQVSAIPVDVTAQTAAEAREQALAAGHREAYIRLMNRLVLREDQSRVPQLGSAGIAELVQDFSIANERASAVRYLADLTFRFKPQAVRRLFQTHRLRFTQTRSAPLVLLPVFGIGGDALLWEDTNAWALAWAEHDFSEELVPLIAPLGDLGDVATINPKRALQGDAKALQDMAARYGADGALVVLAVLSGDTAAGEAALEVTADQFAAGAARRIYEGRFEQAAPGRVDDLFAAAIGAVVGALQDAWKAQTHLSFDEQRLLSAIVPVTGLGDWLEIKRRLNGIASIVQLELVTLTRQYAQVDLGFIGAEDLLMRALAENDLLLQPSANGQWELRLTSAGLEASEPISAPVLPTTPSEPAGAAVESAAPATPDVPAGASGSPVTEE